MYVYQNGKLYAQKDNKLIGVEIYSDNVVLVEGTECEMEGNFQLLTPYEVQCKFGIRDGQSYIFPREKGVIKDVTTPKVKRTTRKSTRE